MDTLIKDIKFGIRSLLKRVIERVEAIPGVESASVARIAVVTGGSRVSSLMIEGRAGSGNMFRSEGSGAASGDAESVSSNVVGPRYFQTIRIGLMQGRDFNAQDRPPVVIVNEAVACYLPARRATKVEPLTALRYE